jgi:hypothetical protein
MARENKIASSLKGIWQFAGDVEKIYTGNTLWKNVASTQPDAGDGNG